MDIIIGLLIGAAVVGAGFYFYTKYKVDIDAKAATLKTNAENTANTTKTDIKNDVSKW